jgi:carbamoyltransferase
VITCGIKLTQSGGVALLDNDRLMFNIEVQKRDNNPRYSGVSNAEFIADVLGEYGYSAADVDAWAVDGWDGARNGHVLLDQSGAQVELIVAPYRETALVPDPIRSCHGGKITFGGATWTYASYVHVSSHLAAAYCTSPFANRGEPSMVLVWDGGCFPRLYFVEENGTVEPGGEVFPFIGHSYSMASQHFGPYRREKKSEFVDDLSVAGKMMAYIALGKATEEVKEVLAELFHKHFEADTPEVRDYRERIIGCGSTGEPSHRYVHAFLEEVHARTDKLGVSDEDVLASVHAFIEDLLVERATAKMRKWKGDGPWNLCFAGGCALNIKWNAAFRSHPSIRAMWVPPFPDDSGSAIGTACVAHARGEALRPIHWGVRLGPDLIRNLHVPAGWSAAPCRPEEVARLLHRTGKPVVFLRGRAELGPRALGGRSILAPAVDPGMKDVLNRMKQREWYRPVAPICLEEHAPTIFDPGTPDPYMLFEHWVRPEWVNRIPAVMHLDGTARLQTVSNEDDSVLATVLREYYNTSANYRGRGFFPDVMSAMEWGQADMVWCEGVLYRRVVGDDVGA